MGDFLDDFPLIKQLEEKKDKIKQQGGPKRIEDQHTKGKLTARERIDILLDAGSFTEHGQFVKTRCTSYGLDKMDIPAEGVVSGVGKINGRSVALFAQDFTVIGGTLGEMHSLKIIKMMDLAARAGIPLIGILDSGGARIQEGIDSLDGYARIFFRNTRYSGVIPQISAVLGPTAGGAVYSPAITDFIIMTQKTGTMYITGPAVVKEVLSEEVTHEQLGGGLIHNQKSGVAQFLAPDDRMALELTRKLLSFFPSNYLEQPPILQTEDPIDREDTTLRQVIPSERKKPYDVKEIIKRVVDDGDFLEVHELYAPNIVVGFAHMGGFSVGIIANQASYLAGVLDINASDKASRFIRFCDCFNIPLLTLTDVPGYMPGTQQEYGGIIRHGAKLLYVYSEATVPKVTLILRKAYGGAYIGMCSKYLGADVVYAYPTAEVAVMGGEGAADIIFRKEIKEAADPEAVKKEKVAEYEAQFLNPYRAAERGSVDEIIDPKDTRIKIIQALQFLSNKREDYPAKKHGNIPL